MQTCSGSALCHFPHALEQLPQHLQHSFNSTNRLLPSRNSSCECKLSNLHSSSSSIKGCLLQFWNSHCWIIMLVIMMLLFVCHTHIYIYTHFMMWEYVLSLYVLIIVILMGKQRYGRAHSSLWRGTFLIRTFLTYSK